MILENKILLFLIRHSPTGKIFSKTDVLYYLRSLNEKFEDHSNTHTTEEKLKREFYEKVELSIFQNLKNVNSFVLLQINLESIPYPETILNPETIIPYKEMFLKSGWCPPIIFNPKTQTLIDGRHRVCALKILGEKKILAFVPI